MKLLLENPRSLKAGVERLAEVLHQRASPATLRRLLRAAGYVWKRMRRSLRGSRDEADYQRAAAELTALRRDAALPASEFELAWFDETGLTLTPVIPYAWQPVGTTLALPCARSKRLNVLGGLNQRGELFSLTVEGRVDGQVVAQMLESYCRQLTRPTLLVLDNAPIHRCAAIEASLPRWAEAGLFLYWLPRYSPELNLIEILWRKLKYEWLPLSAYASFQALTAATLEVLKQVGSKYRITFA